jgi:hypothetical protein
MLGIAALLLVGAALVLREGVRRRRRGHTRPRAPQVHPYTDAGKRTHRLLLVFFAATALAAIANVALNAAQSDSTGVLRLECRHRCEFDGMTCLPGGVMELRLDPGEYPVKVWNAARADPWEQRSFAIEAGERTQFVCEPG